MTRISNPLAIPLLIQLLRQGEAAQAEAKAANEARRDDIIKGRTDTRGRVLDQWKGYGESLTADTNQGYDKNLNNSLAALQNSGLGQSTVNSSIRSRNETERQNALRRVKDDITSNYANTDERLSNNIDEFKERITDAYPDNSSLNSITALLGQLMGNGGRGGLGGGYGGGYPTMPYRPQALAAAPQGGYSMPGTATPIPDGMEIGKDGKLTPIDPRAYQAAIVAQLNAANAANSPSAASTAAKLPWQMDPSHSGAALDADPNRKRLYEPTPALGIFGGGTQFSDRGGYGYGTQVPYGQAAYGQANSGYGYRRPARGTNQAYQQRQAANKPWYHDAQALAANQPFLSAVDARPSQPNTGWTSAPQAAPSGALSQVLQMLGLTGFGA